MAAKVKSKGKRIRYTDPDMHTVPKPAPIVDQRALATFDAKHPLRHEGNNKKLVAYVLERLNYANKFREEFVDVLEKIEREVSGYQQLSPEERAREREIESGYGMPGTELRLQLVDAKIDETVTFLMDVFVPDGSMFEAATDAKKQNPANSLTLLMNQHAEQKMYYREFAKCFQDSMKFNLCGCTIEWSREIGAQLGSESDGTLKVEETTVFEGNVIKHIDLYNCLWDVTVHPVDLAAKGEFVAVVEQKTTHRVQRMHENGEIFGAEELLRKDYSSIYSNDGKTFYKTKPSVRRGLMDSTGGRENNATDWVSILKAESGKSLGTGYEFVTIWIWLDPRRFGLSKSATRSVWRLIMVDGCRIVAADEMTNVHSQLPVAFGSPLEDNLGLDQKGMAEKLLPWQRFGSNMANIHIAAARKALYGLTFYDPSIFPLDQAGKDPNARIPANPAGYGKKMSDGVFQLNDAPRTESTMANLQMVMQMLEATFPTSRQSVADLDRATQYQAAATVQAVNRRSFKIAKILNDQMMGPARRQMVYNILQWQPSVTLNGPDGNPIEVNPRDLRTISPEFAIGEGLKSLDRLTMLMYLRELLNSIIQSGPALQEIDIVAFMSYVSRLMGINVDLNQFRRPPPQIGPDGQPLPNTQPAQQMQPQRPGSAPGSFGVTS